MFSSMMVAAIGSLLSVSATLSGQVVGPSGQPVAMAQVFAEPSISALLATVQASADGAFRFEDVTPGTVGVFALAEGFSFGGTTVKLAAGDSVSNLDIHLYEPDHVSGRVINQKKDPVAEAQITRIALLGESKVGIPLSKLAAFNIKVPVSDNDGRFAIERLPKGQNVALKIGHPRYAQEAVDNVAVGNKDVQVMLYNGVLIRGTVLSQSRGLSLASASVIIQNAAPPYDSVVTNTDAAGNFAVQLKPGVYVYQASGGGYQTPGWERLTVTGELPDMKISLRALGAGTVRGKALDARTEKPIKDVRFTIESQGVAAAIVRTGPTGDFQANVTEGENTITLELAPGYQVPASPSLRVQVTEGETTELPTFWLAPLPTYRIRILGTDETPQAGVLVHVVRPAQFGWHVSDAEGRVSIHLASSPAGGMLIGTAEHREQPLGALFALDAVNVDEAAVQLLPLGTVRGRIVTEKGEPVEGAVVSGLCVTSQNSEPELLWRTVSSKDGHFEWTALVPHVPYRCVVDAGTGVSAHSESFVVEPGENKELPDMVVSGVQKGASLYGESFKWYDNRLVAGTLPDKSLLRTMPAVVMYCTSTDAPTLIEGLSALDLQKKGIVLAVIVDGVYSGPSSSIPVLSGRAPATASTYVLDNTGTVVLETFGLPPLQN